MLNAMNRKQRRKNEKNGTQVTREKIYTLKESDINRIIQEKLQPVTEIATTEAFLVAMRVFALALNNQEGWGLIRMQRILDRVMLQLDCIIAGTLSGKDILQFCNEKNLIIELDQNK